MKLQKLFQLLNEKGNYYKKQKFVDLLNGKIDIEFVTLPRIESYIEDEEFIVNILKGTIERYKFNKILNNYNYYFIEEGRSRGVWLKQSDIIKEAEIYLRHMLPHTTLQGIHKDNNIILLTSISFISLVLNILLILRYITIKWFEISTSFCVLC